MADLLVDFRGKMTLDTDRVLSAMAQAQGSDKSEIVRQVMHEWALKQIRFAASLIQELTSETSDVTERIEQGVERSKMTASLRATVLARDNFKCQCCGATDRDFHVDHIVPISAGGKTVLTNLQALCAPCNIAKGAKVIELRRQTGESAA